MNKGRAGVNRANFKAYMVGGFLAASALSGPLRAQVADASAEGQADPVAGKPAATGEPQSVQADGDIIVTAQRRSESLQRTPVAEIGRASCWERVWQYVLIAEAA